MSLYEENRATLWVKSAGVDSERPIKLGKKAEGNTVSLNKSVFIVYKPLHG